MTGDVAEGVPGLRRRVYSQKPRTSIFSQQLSCVFRSIAAIFLASLVHAKNLRRKPWDTATAGPVINCVPAVETLLLLFAFEKFLCRNGDLGLGKELRNNTGNFLECLETLLNIKSGLRSDKIAFVRLN